MTMCYTYNMKTLIKGKEKNYGIETIRIKRETW